MKPLVCPGVKSLKFTMIPPPIAVLLLLFSFCLYKLEYNAIDLQR